MKSITIYSTPTCHFCHLAKNFLNEQGIPFTEYNVAADLEKRKEMVALTGQLGVPVIAVEGQEPMVGYREDLLRAALGM